MKKIYKSLFFIGAMLCITSCDMDKFPQGVLDDQTAIQSLNDCTRFRSGIYGDLRSITNGSYVYLTDLQMDQFQATKSFGNRNGIIHSGSFTSADGEFSSFWLDMYGKIASVNYFLREIEKLRKGELLQEDELQKVNLYEGEAKFLRAYAYYWLMDHYCVNYSKSNANDPATGLPLVTEYNPTGNTSVYPGRSTLEETYSLIETDLNDAYSALIAYEKTDDSNLVPDASYLSSYAVLALQARIALLKGDNTTAITKAESVINSGKYSLTEIADYKKMWKDDISSENIFRPIKSDKELAGSIGQTFLSQELNKADFIPSAETLNLYNPTTDVRFETFFKIWTLVNEDLEVNANVFYKYPGNKKLMLDGTKPNFQNMGKPFRLSELYLIVAEAAATTDAAKANKYLNALREKRLQPFKPGNFEGKLLIDQIRLERQRELLGEGFRMSDLRRWGVDFKRGVKHPENPEIENILSIVGKGLSYSINDYRYVWPIPSEEIESNPQMTGQQNPGY